MFAVNVNLLLIYESIILIMLDICAIAGHRGLITARIK